MNTFLLLFSNKIMVIKAGIHKILVRITNREDPDQTVSSEAVWSESALFVQAFLDSNPVFEILEHLLYIWYKHESSRHIHVWVCEIINQLMMK